MTSPIGELMAHAAKVREAIDRQRQAAADIADTVRRSREAAQAGQAVAGGQAGGTGQE